MGTGACEDAQGRHCEEGCDPQMEGSCGPSGICVTLQDDDGNALGDFCFESCLQAPNECPQGYQCVEFEQNAGAMSGGSAELTAYEIVHIHLYRSEILMEAKILLKLLEHAAFNGETKDASTSSTALKLPCCSPLKQGRRFLKSNKPRGERRHLYHHGF